MRYVRMEYPRPPEIMFPDVTEQPWMSEDQMLDLMAKITGPSNFAERIGRSTTFKITKVVHDSEVMVRLTLTRDSINIAGDIQPGLQGMFHEHWDTVKNYTEEMPEDGDILRVVYPIHEDNPYFLAVNFGGGFKSYFALHVSTQDELKTMVKMIFDVDI